MVKQIKSICKACQQCQAAKIRRQQLSAAFEQADKEDLPLPRQAYGIDFYGHTCQNSDTTTQETTPSPFPSTSSYALTRQTQSKLSEGDGEKEVVNKRRFLSSSGLIYFCSLLLVNIK